MVSWGEFLHPKGVIQSEKCVTQYEKYVPNNNATWYMYILKPQCVIHIHIN